MNRFEPRLVAYIDILGLSAALSSAHGARRYAEALDAILTPVVRDKEEPWLVLPHIRSGEEIEVDLSLPVTRRSRVTTISDAILLSVPFGARARPDERMRRIFTCLRAVYGIQQSLLALGLRTRGGIAVGGLIHKSHLVVGQGLVQAYKLESEVAIYPRVIIDRSIIRLLVEGPIPDMVYFRNRVAHIVRQDSDGAYFIDYLSFDPVITGTRMSDHLVRIYREVVEELAHGPSLRVEQKLRWMIGYFDRMLVSRKETGDERRSHAEAYFADKFYRNDENLRTFVAELERQHGVREPI
jgi:hypothetical protein